MIHFIFLVYLHYIHLKFHQLFGDGLCLLDHVVVLGKAKPLGFKLEFNMVSRAGIFAEAMAAVPPQFGLMPSKNDMPCSHSGFDAPPTLRQLILQLSLLPLSCKYSF